MTGRIWTEEDEERLISLWARHTMGQIAEDLGVSTMSVKVKAHHLRTCGHYLPYKYKKWTREDDQRFLELRKEKMDPEISKMMNRTPAALRMRANLLKKRGYDISPRIQNGDYPRRYHRWTSEEETYLTTNVNAMGIDAMARHLKRTQLGIANRVKLHEEDGEFDPTIIEYADALLEPYTNDYEKQKGDGSE